MDRKEERHWRVLSMLLKEIRLATKLNQWKFAERAALSRSSVQNAETLRRRPSEGNLFRYCVMAGISRMELTARWCRVEAEWERDGRWT